ncbi:hypothetical protein Cs7R123_27250 [Catellatospora sp. TT07R-123]|uniref:hypothetical protein n=1 Tax=Catellatospora sp. TT07R-123 TaxID=2733863 RepID=UPI001B0BA16E|nr:hypothetical protein [Catellatospora sp. TT07R-123]GHJ45383.1 hypothetical protein Cs7R123_27250 [Catellatospora sp. TT07R-123]
MRRLPLAGPLPRLVAAAGAATLTLVLSLLATVGLGERPTSGWAAAAQAAQTVAINPGNVPTTAAAFKPDGHDCDPDFGGGPLPGMDIWVFDLPGNHDSSGDFTRLRLTFDVPGAGIVAVAVPDDGGAIVRNGTSKAWIATPAGWTLTAASADITGTASSFVLTHTCPAAGPSPSPHGGKYKPRPLAVPERAPAFWLWAQRLLF